MILLHQKRSAKFLLNILVHGFPNKFERRFVHISNYQCSSKNYYEILGLNSNCSQKEIRLAYLDLCKKYHPDKVVNDGDKMKARFQLINEAYNCLSKKSKRSMYDQSLRYNTEPWQQYRPQYYQRQQTYYYDHRQHREQQEFYQKMYRMHQEYQQKHPPNQNDDIKVDLKFIGVLLTTIILSSIIMVTILQVTITITFSQVNTINSIRLIKKLQLLGLFFTLSIVMGFIFISIVISRNMKSHFSK